MEYEHKLLTFLAENKDRLSPLLILTHDYPDPDALASAYALQHLAERTFGIKGRIVYGGIIGRSENREMAKILRLPIHRVHATDFEKYQTVALVDTQPGFGNNSLPPKRKATIVVDQHASNVQPTAECTIIDTSAGATSVILAQALLESKTEIPTRLATALVYGILSDTLNLYRAGRPEILETYLTLLPLSDLKALTRIQNPERSRAFFATLQRSIENAMMKRRLIVSHLGHVESPDLVSQIADFLLSFKGVTWAFCTGRYGEFLHVSLRLASPGGAAGEILRDIFSNRGQAGGHGSIAGGKLKIGSHDDEHLWEGTEQLLTQRLVKRLRIPAKVNFTYPFRRTPAPLPVEAEGQP
jgi:nanoRNase/pAp phosphatase (c-di-AMP/oligoRNAs hydrolase)